MTIDRLSPGTRVMAGQLGSATVLTETPRGVKIRLDNPAGLMVDWPRDGLMVQAAPVPEGGDEPVAPMSAGAHPIPPPTTAPATQHVAAPGLLRAIEALRFGVVPRSHLAELSLGYEAFREWVEDQLPHRTGGFPRISEVAGPFGTGKSHSMAVIRHVARSLGYLTASVEVDGKTISLSDPVSLLGALWPSLSGRDHDSASPIVELHQKAVQRVHPRSSQRLQAMDRVTDNAITIHYLEMSHKTWQDHDELFERLLGSDPTLTITDFRRELFAGPEAMPQEVDWDSRFKPKTLISWTVADRARNFVHAILGYATLAEMAGYRGLVVTIDEFEVERFLAPQMRKRVVDLLGHLIAYVSQDRLAQAWPAAVFVASVGQAGHVGDDLIEQVVQLSGGSTYELTEWSRAELLDLAHRVCTLYREAYGVESPMSADEVVIDRVASALDTYELDTSGMIRAFLRRLVQELDAAWGPPGNA